MNCVGVLRGNMCGNMMKKKVIKYLAMIRLHDLGVTIEGILDWNDETMPEWTI